MSTKWAIALIAIIGFTINLYACRKDGSSQVNRAMLSGVPVHSENAAPFVPAEISTIEGNHMHELHFAGGTVCGECHLSTEPMPVTRAHEVCSQCHPNQTVSDPVWSKHCLACHHFTIESQEAAGDPAQLTQGLCVKCHADGGPGGMIFTFHHEPRGHRIVCSRCHRPHEQVAPAAEELCLECHPEHEETWHPTGEGVRCAICHQPHRKPPEGDALCTQCHGQATDVAVHQIPVHPKDCLACHTAHFNKFELKNGCNDCHNEQADSDLLNQTSGHNNCSGCHRENDFTFKGNRSCATCHSVQGAILQDEQAPAEHQNCRTCHKPHTWRARASNICDGCHQDVDVLEHHLTYHPKDCAACHDAHLTANLPQSGDCGGCHTGDDAVPAFAPSAPMPHKICANCHDDAAVESGNFAFAGEQASCRQCHADAGAGTSWGELPENHRSCAVCHKAHVWDIASSSQSCQVCHAGIAAEAPNAAHNECFICHSSDHRLEFAGVEGSCNLCHASPPGAHSANGHNDCFLCHQQHTFAADRNNCLICHADKSEGHYTSEGGCVDCHSFSG